VGAPWLNTPTPCYILPNLHPPLALALSWHDDFAAFKAGVRDLEVMLENVMAAALAATPGLPAALELLEAFARAAVRPALRRALARAAAGFYGRWAAELSAVKRQLEGLRRAPPRDPALPRYAGAAQ
jgi:dynein heavy chain